MKKIKRALISVSDKTNLNQLIKVLKKYKVEIISSGGTFKKIKKLKYRCKEVSEYTGSPEILGGRVKTLHPKIHAGILNKRQNKSHKKDLIKNNFKRRGSGPRSHVLTHKGRNLWTRAARRCAAIFLPGKARKTLSQTNFLKNQINFENSMSKILIGFRFSYATSNDTITEAMSLVKNTLKKLVF